ncbi:unnamed protein product, partial [Meganyctiphanes norvegica]
MGSGGLSSGAECLRFMIYSINLLMVICSFALIVLCGFCLGKHDLMVDLLGESTAWVVISIIMVTAVIVFLVSLLGCCGAMKENDCMLKTYICIIFTLLLTLLILAGLAYGYKDPTRDIVYEHMKGKMMEYNPDESNSTITTVWDDMQSWVNCCGIDNYTDWSQYCNYYHNNSTNSTSGPLFPDSCLIEGSNDPYDKGCLDTAEYWLHSNIWILVGIIAGCAASMVMAMCCVCWLIRSIDKYDQFDLPQHRDTVIYT